MSILRRYLILHLMSDRDDRAALDPKDSRMVPIGLRYFSGKDRKFQEVILVSVTEPVVACTGVPVGTNVPHLWMPVKVWFVRRFEENSDT